MITFIVPTLNRSSLKATLKSLVEQFSPNWKAIVAGDGVEPTRWYDDDRIQYLEMPCNDSAGLTRNLAIDEVTTNWVAFVDDDDVLHPKYVSALTHSIKWHEFDVVVFRMHHPVLGILPPKDDPDPIKPGKVGISYAVKTKFFKDKGLQFIPEDIGAVAHEDITLLEELMKMKATFCISPEVTYYVRPA